MKRTIALPLLAMAFAVSVIFASRTPRLITEELPQEKVENPALLTLTEKAGGRQTVTLPLTTGLLGEWLDARLER